VGDGVVIWQEFGFQSTRDDQIQSEGFESVGPFVFDGREYHRLLSEQIKGGA